MSIYPDKKHGILTGRWRVEVQVGGLCKRVVRHARWLTSPRSCGPKYVNRRSVRHNGARCEPLLVIQ
jgi:hypothetical protein